MPRTVPQTPNTVCSRYVASGHELRDTAGPCSRLTRGSHQTDRLRGPGPAHKRAIAGRLRERWERPLK